MSKALKNAVKQINDKRTAERLALRDQRLSDIKALIPSVNDRLRSIRKTYGKDSDIYARYTRYYNKVFGPNGRNVLTKTGNVSIRELKKVYAKGMPTKDYNIMMRNLQRIPTVSDIRTDALKFAEVDDATIKRIIHNPKKQYDNKFVDEFVEDKVAFEDAWGGVKDQFYDIEVMMNAVDPGSPRRGSRHAKVEFFVTEDDDSLTEKQKQQMSDMKDKLDKLQNNLEDMGDNKDIAYNKIKKAKAEMDKFNREFMALRNSIRGGV